MERVDFWVPRVEAGASGKLLLMGTEYLCGVGVVGDDAAVLKLTVLMVAQLCEMSQPCGL